MGNAIEFLLSIAANPTDELLRLVFADWLEEQGDWRAEYLRLDGKLHANGNALSEPDDQKRWRELRARLSFSWLAVLGRAKIEECQPRFRMPCPEKWERLKATEVATVRFCEGCHQTVHYCSSIEEAKQHTEAGKCVAVDASVPRQPDDLSSDTDLLLGVMDFESFEQE